MGLAWLPAVGFIDSLMDEKVIVRLRLSSRASVGRQAVDNEMGCHG